MRNLLIEVKSFLQDTIKYQYEARGADMFGECRDVGSHHSVFTEASRLLRRTGKEQIRWGKIIIKQITSKQ